MCIRDRVEDDIGEVETLANYRPVYLALGGHIDDHIGLHGGGAPEPPIGLHAPAGIVVLLGGAPWAEGILTVLDLSLIHI